MNYNEKERERTMISHEIRPRTNYTAVRQANAEEILERLREQRDFHLNKIQEIKVPLSRHKQRAKELDRWIQRIERQAKELARWIQRIEREIA